MTRLHGQYAALLISMLWSAIAVTAEVRGSVEFKYNGIFGASSEARKQPISVALMPIVNQAALPSKPQIHHMKILDNRISPAFSTVRLGDKLIFVNSDAVYHQLFSLSHDIPFDVVLEKSTTGKPKQASINLDKTGTVHIFCRIHNKSYARVDVLDTPHQQIITSGQPFRFNELAAGRWLLRLASPASETRLIPVDAVTSPPPLTLQLNSHGGGTVLNNLAVSPAIGEMYQ